jgi:TrmH family RNA methyltransferase
MITSIQNPKIKRIRGLQTQAKLRRKELAYVVEGVRLLEEVVSAGQTPEIVIYTEDLDQRGTQLVEHFHQLDINLEEVTKEVFKSACQTESPQGILAVLPQTTLPVPDLLDFVLIADQIRDPGNLGTLLRTAHAAGVQLVLLTPGTVDPYSPKVVRSGMGAHFNLPIVVCSWDDLPRFSEGIILFGSHMTLGTSLWETDLQPPLGLIIGGEAFGLGEEARKLVDAWVTIPMQGNTESLNASAAGAVLLFEVFRQRSRFSDKESA